MKVVVLPVTILIAFSAPCYGLHLCQDPPAAPGATVERMALDSPLRIEGDSVFATVAGGILTGAVVTSELGTQYASFRGVPYAQPPVGELRFQPPRATASWMGARDAVQHAPACPQTRRSSTSEDCLYLNVFVPLGASAAPVLVWIPGGGFDGGTSEYEGPDFFIQEGVLLVAFNYRVGSLGFLSTADDVAPGNVGLKDQLRALQWVQENIAAFGGDPTKVTVGGESAGGCSVGHLLISPAATGLFQQATIISGEAISPWGVLEEPRPRAFRLGEALGLTTNDSQQLVDFLRTQDAADLVRHDSDVIPEDERIRVLAMPWMPVVEPDVQGAVVRDLPINNLRAGSFSRLPLLVGFTSGDGLIGAQMKGYLSSASALQQLNDNFVSAVAPLVRLPTQEQREAAALRIRDFYFGDRNNTANDTQALVSMLTDFGFVEPSDSAVRIIANQSDAAPIYYHLFDYRGPSIGNATYGTPHASQRSVLFSGIVKNPDEEFTQLRTKMVRLWANFVKYGTPSPEGETIEWRPFTGAEHNYLHVTDAFQLKQDVYKERMDFWHDIVPV